MWGSRLLIFLPLLLAPLVVAQTAEKPKSRAVVATVAGKPIYEDELQPLMKAQLQQLRNQEYEIKKNALDQLIQTKTLEVEAAKQGLSVEALLQRDIEHKVPKPTDAEVESTYAKEKNRLGRPLEEIRTQLREAMIKERWREAFQEYIVGLRQKADVNVLLSVPRVNVSHDAARVRGNPKAPITIVEFSDFQCGFCQRVTPTLRQILAKYGTQVNLSYRDYPLREIHPLAQQAAEAARCAGEQGKFWEYHDVLFATSKLEKPSLLEHAQGLGLDEKNFSACLDSGKFKAAIDSDMQDAEKSGVSATPAFFVNGIFLEGAQPLAAFEKVIESERRAAR